MPPRSKHNKPVARPEIRNRVVELRHVRAGDLKHHPRNWRTHPKEQRAVIGDLFQEVGFIKPVDVYVAREGDAYVSDGKLSVGDLVLMDGHLRVEELPPDFLVPVNVTDLNETEAIKYLVTADPLSALAGQDDDALMELLGAVDSGSTAVQKMLGDLIDLDEEHTPEEDTSGDGIGGGSFQIIITCTDEAQQRALLDQLTADGVTCKSLIG